MIGDQYDAISVLFRIVRRRYARHYIGSPNDHEDRQIDAAVRLVLSHCVDRDDKVVALDMLGQSCEFYWVLTTGGQRNEAYTEVFQDAFWKCCTRLSNIPGAPAHECLTQFDKILPDVHDKRYLKDLIEHQSLLATTEATPKSQGSQ
jgi:hypothetical protein